MARNLEAGRTWWVVVSILFLPCVVAERCPGWLEWNEICCKTPLDLGCFTTTPPHHNLPLPCCLEGDDVTFSLYTRRYKQNPWKIRLGEHLPCEFSANRIGGTVFIIHGWQSSGKEKEFQLMKDALLEADNYNVVVVTWLYKHYYRQSAADIRVVGRLVSMVLDRLATDAGARYDRMWCIGHSLGAHACGFAGRKTKQLIGRITGLDPAGPSFENVPDLRVGLNKQDAQFVDVIHTDNKDRFDVYGTIRALGHMDFYVNGRDIQPGCWDKRKRRGIFDYFPGCSHVRAIDLFTESIDTDCFVSRYQCNTTFDLPKSCYPCNNGTYGDDACAVIGYKARGNGDSAIYYLSTSSNFPPHCLG